MAAAGGVLAGGAAEEKGDTARLVRMRQEGNITRSSAVFWCITPTKYRIEFAHHWLSICLNDEIIDREFVYNVFLLCAHIPPVACNMYLGFHIYCIVVHAMCIFSCMSLWRVLTTLHSAHLCHIRHTVFVHWSNGNCRPCQDDIRPKRNGQNTSECWTRTERHRNKWWCDDPEEHICW